MHNSDFEIKHTFKIRSRCVGDVCLGALIWRFVVVAGSLGTAALRSMQSSLKLIDRSQAPQPPPSKGIIWPSPTLEGFGRDGGRIPGVGERPRSPSPEWAAVAPRENSTARSLPPPPPRESMAPSLPRPSPTWEGIGRDGGRSPGFERGRCDAPVWPYAHRRRVHIMHSMYVFYIVYVF